MSSIICHFWNVGQGLFSSGKVSLPNQKEFVWVYDCGSTNQKYITEAVNNMKQTYQNDVIDLLAISHFDKDHINGLSELLKGRKVKYWLLPYYPLWQRLLVALSLDFQPDSDEFRFCVNPAQFIIEQYASHFEDKSELLFVPTLNADQEIRFSENKETQSFSYQENKEFENEWADISHNNISIKLLDPTKPAIIQGVEFVPYNMPLANLQNQPTDIQQFQQDVRAILNSQQTIKQKTASLQKLYDTDFKQRNAISLFLYIGKIDRSYQVSYFAEKFKGSPNNTDVSIIYYHYLYNKYGILYTGDGYLDTKQKLKFLQKALGNSRIGNIFAFQVPHHGSKNNAYIGLAQDICPVFSIFSARGSKHHPHASIFTDFMRHNPILVNQDNGFYFSL